MEQPGRPEAGQYVAAKSVGRAVHLVAFALRHAAESGVPFERLVELTGWEPDLVRAGLQRPVPEPLVVARFGPRALDAGAVAEAAAASRQSGVSKTSRNVLADIALDLDLDARLPLTRRPRRSPRPDRDRVAHLAPTSR